MKFIQTLHAITALGLLPDNVEHGVDELSPLRVMALGPVIPGAGLPENEVVGAEDLAVGAGSDRIHGARLKIHEDGAGDVPPLRRLVEVDIEALQAHAIAALVSTGGVHVVLLADHLPELGADLVAALSTLNVKDFSHVLISFLFCVLSFCDDCGKKVLIQGKWGM